MASHRGTLHPGGASVNDGINPDEFTLHYIAVDQVIRRVSQFGQGALNIVKRLKVLFSSCKTVVLYLVGSSQIGFGRSSPLLVFLEIFPATVSA